ncbi:hypothetical protein [Anaeromyxobacter paludicola]|uniref:Transmembrane protein n=1 Tax=Anaeromyxobacter paludicola TaxID=2918171 RepID=A0ABM7XCI0_9BACT|nr:hypothetical protein [Anaeromyxobacter paludicola]BDG09579.1 hypothetical protein AMPC_26920 [Anaeromyxobacter paludicola]
MSASHPSPSRAPEAGRAARARAAGSATGVELLERGLFALLLALAAAPLLLPTVGLLDYPEHLLQLTLAGHLGEPAFGGGALYRAHLASPYGGMVLLGRPLAAAFGEDAALRLLVFAGIAGFALAARHLLGALGRDRGLALLAVPLGWSWCAWMGFVPFLLCLPVVLLCGAEAWRVALRPAVRWTHLLPLAALALLAFAFHPFALPLAALLAAVLPLAAGRPRRAVAAGLALAPTLAAALAWLVTRPRGLHPEPLPLFWWTVSSRFEWLCAYLNGLGPEELRPKLFAGAAALVLAGAALASRYEASPRGRRACAIAALALFLAMFAVPQQAMDAWGLPGRLPPLAAAFALGLSRLPRRPGRRALALAALAAVSAADLAGVHAQLAAFSREATPGRLLAASLPPGTDLQVVFRLTSRHLPQSVYRHFGAYHVAAAGGSTNGGFLEMPHQPVRLASGRALPPPALADHVLLQAEDDTCPVPPPLAGELVGAAPPLWLFRGRLPDAGWRLVLAGGAPRSRCRLEEALNGPSPWCRDDPYDDDAWWAWPPSPR